MINPPDNTHHSAGPGAPSGTPSTEIERDAKATSADTKQAAASAEQKAGKLGEQAKQAASGAAADAKRQARSFAQGQKDEAAGQVGGVAEALRSAAGSLDDQDQRAVAGYARQAASGLDRVSDALSNRSIDDLIETVEDFARHQPIAFLGGSVLAGFVMSRFAKSSAERRNGGSYRTATGDDAGAPAYRAADPDARQPLESGGHDLGGHAAPVTPMPDQETN